MKVTEFAKRAGVAPDVVRYYVREGLLAPTRNPSNGYKLFGNPHLARIRFIRKTQALGFTLAEIRNLMARVDGGGCPCEDMQEQLRIKIVESRIRLREMQERLRLMEEAYADWNRTSGSEVGALCRVVEDAPAG